MENRFMKKAYTLLLTILLLTIFSFLSIQILQTKAIKSDVFAFLQKHKGSYDIIFADPPYHIDQKDFEKIPVLIFENDILDEEGMLIIEHSKDTKLEHLDNFSLIPLQHSLLLLLLFLYF